ncbi:MAG: replication/maintenance protein RepL, partial [Lachnospiraceae bacterium]|nr:replication/maintenance protein RepL [Lachnospiraceae bacterium]
EKKVYEEIIVSEETGEIREQKTVYKTKEPDYVKLYLDCVLILKGLQKGLNPILIEFVKYMNYADINGFGGGQVIFVNKTLKETIANSLNVSLKRIEQAITQFVKAGIFKRISVGTYQVNPNIFGKGEWKDIKNIRATFDFANKAVVADIVRYEENEMSEQQETLEKRAEGFIKGVL